MIPFYRKIFKSALTISWKNKWLWFFGIFAALLGQVSIYQFIFRMFNNLSEGGSIFSTLSEYANSSIFGMLSWSNLQAIWQLDPGYLGISIFVILLTISACLVFVSLAIIAQGGLVGGVVGIDQGKSLSFRQVFNLGVNKFWSILALNILAKVVFLSVLMFVSYLVSLILPNINWLATLIFIILFVIFVVLGIIVYFMTLYGTAYIVLRDSRMFESIKMSLNLFKQHILLNIEMGFLLFIINFVVSLVFSFVAFVLLSPFVLLYFILLLADAYVAISIVGIFIIIFASILMLVMVGFYSSFQIAVWSLLFEEQALGRASSKIKRVFDHFKTKIANR